MIMAIQLAYDQIYQQLRNRILQGYYAVGQKIPTERQLCEEFRVSRITTRHALQLLQDQGLLERRQGRGTFVRSFRTPKFPILNTDYTRSVTTALPQMQRQLRRSGLAVPPCPIAEQLGIPRTEACFFAERVDMTPDGPIAFDRAYIRQEMSRQLDEATLVRVDFLEAWSEKERFQMSHFTEVIEAVTADSEAAEILNLKPNSPLLMTTDIVYSQEGKIVGVFESYYRGDKVKLISTVRKGQIDVASDH